MQFRGEDDSGHVIVMDTSEEFGGENSGVKPIDMLLIALGGCSGMDIVEILRKKKQEITGYEIAISGERRDEHPRVFTSIKVEHIFRGKNIDPAAVARAVELSSDKYCSVMAMLNQAVDIEVGYRIEDE